MKNLIACVLSWLIPLAITQDTQNLGLFVDNGIIEITTKTGFTKRGNAFEIDSSSVNNYKVDLSSLSTIIKVEHIEISTPTNEKQLSDIKVLRQTVLTNIKKGEKLVATYLEFFKVAIQGKLKLKTHPDIKLFRYESLGMSYLSVQLSTLIGKGDQNLDTSINVLKETLVRILKLNEELARIVKLINSIKTNYYDNNTLKYIESLYNQTDIMDVFTENMQSSATSFKFEIKIITALTFESRKNLKNVQIFNYILEDRFYKNEKEDKGYSYICNGKFCIRDQHSKCVVDLNSKNLTHVLNHCSFKKSYKIIDICAEGILIYSGESSSVNALLKTLELKVDLFPSLVQFTGKYNLDIQGSIFMGAFALKEKIIPTKYIENDLPLIFNQNFLQLILAQWDDIPFLITISVIFVANMLIFTISIKICKFLHKNFWTRCKIMYNPIRSAPAPSDDLVLMPLNIATTSKRAQRSTLSQKK
jgi:hypothetical protein